MGDILTIYMKNRLQKYKKIIKQTSFRIKKRAVLPKKCITARK